MGEATRPAMDPVAVTQSNSAAFSARDVDGLLAHYAPDAEVIDRRRVGFGTFHGHAELRPYYQGIFESAAEMSETLEVLAAGGDVVVAHCELRGRLAQTGLPAGAEYGLVLTVRDGLIQRLEICEDGRHALAVSGLGPQSPPAI